MPRKHIPPVNRVNIRTAAIHSSGSHQELLDILLVGDQGGGYDRELYDWPVVYELKFHVEPGDVVRAWGEAMVTTERPQLVAILSYLELENPDGTLQLMADKEGENVRQSEGHHLRLRRLGVVASETAYAGTATVRMHLGAFDFGVGGFPHYLDIGADADPRERSYGQMVVEVLR